MSASSRALTGPVSGHAPYDVTDVFDRACTGLRRMELSS